MNLDHRATDTPDQQNSHPGTDDAVAFARELLEADKKPPESRFDNIEDLLRWLNDNPSSEGCGQ